MPESIKIADGTTLTLQRARAHARPMEAERALSALRLAKQSPTVMQRLRLLVPQAATHMSDDEMLGLIATNVAHGSMVLHIRSPFCTADKQRFFDWLADSLADMADDLGTTPQIMLTLAVKEGGWNKPALDHNQPLNNPFGMNLIKKGQAAGISGIGHWTMP